MYTYVCTHSTADFILFRFMALYVFFFLLHIAFQGLFKLKKNSTIPNNWMWVGGRAKDPFGINELERFVQWSLFIAIALV